MKTLLALLLAISLPAFVHADWGTDYKAALAQAKAQNKLVLLHFTGSDWCPACKLLDKEVLDRAEFNKFADKAYIKVTLDYPEGKSLPDALKNQNDALKDHYNVQGFPTLIVANAEGKELGRQEGYDSGSGVNAVVTKLKSFK